MTTKQLLLHQIDSGFNKKSWHGPTLKGVLRGVEEELASWRPAPDRHTIWELTVHAAYWKYAVHRRLTGATRGSFPLKGSNWFTRPDGKTSWKSELRLLDEVHKSFRAEVESMPLTKLDTHPGDSAHSLLEQVLGVAAHDLYHAGQIQLMKRLARESSLKRFQG